MEFSFLKTCFYWDSLFATAAKTDPQRVKPKWIIGLLALEHGQEQLSFQDKQCSSWKNGTEDFSGEVF